MRVPAITVSRGKAAREHVVLEHVVEADVKSTGEQDGNQAKDKGNEVNA